MTLKFDSISRTAFAAVAGGDVGQAGSIINKGSFDFFRCILIQAVTMNYMSRHQPCSPYLSNNFNFRGNLIFSVVFLQLFVDVGKYPVSLSSPDIKGLSVSWVDQSINIVP